MTVPSSAVGSRYSNNDGPDRPSAHVWKENKEMKSAKILMFGLAAIAGSLGHVNAQNVLASKTVTINEHNVVNANAPRGWNETYGSDANDLMIVNAPVAARSEERRVGKEW